MNNQKNKIYKKLSLKSYVVILGVDLNTESQYVLSTSDKEIILPNFMITSQHLDNLDEYLVQELRKLTKFPTDDLYLQLINLHSKFIKIKPGEINIVYGCILDKLTIENQNVFWYPFDYETITDWSMLLFEVSQKLK